MGELWRSRQWVRLLGFIDRLPRGSAFCEALADDEELAALVVDDPPAPGALRRVSDWTPQVELLSDIFDRLGELIQTTIAAAGVKPGRVSHAPRPTTAADRLRRRRLEQRHRSIVARVLPGRT